METLQNAEETLPKNIESIELKDLSGATNDVIGTTGDVETALKTIDDPPMDVAWATQAARELAGVRKAMTRVRDELANNLAKLSDVDDRKSEVEKYLARERQNLTETDDTEIQQDIRDRMKKLQSSPTSSLSDKRGSKPSPRTKQLSGPKLTEFVRPSGGSSMKTRRWLSELELSSANRG